MRQPSSLLRYGGYTFSVGGARLIGLSITSLTFPYIVRHLGVETYGVWSYVVAIRTFLDIAADPGIANYATQQVAARRKEAFRIMPDVLLLRAICSLAALVIVLVVARFEARADVRQLLLLYCIGSLPVSLVSSEAFLSSLELFHVRSLLMIGQQVVYAVGIFTLVHSREDAIWLPVSILGSAVLSGLAGWIVLAKRGFTFSPVVHPSEWKGILIPSFHYAGSTLMSNTYRRAGLLVVRWFLGDFAVGLYGAVTRFLDLLRGFVIIISQVLMPRMAVSARSPAEFSRLGKLSLAVVVIVCAPIALCLLGFAPIIVPLVLGSKFLAAVPLLRWMALYMISSPLAYLFASTMLFSQGRHRAYLACTAGGALSGMALYLVLIPIMGLAGAGLTFVLAECAVAAIAYKLLPELRDAWKNPLVFVALASSLLILVSVRVVSLYVSKSIVALAAGGLIYVAICGWCARKLLLEQIAGS